MYIDNRPVLVSLAGTIMYVFLHQKGALRELYRDIGTLLGYSSGEV